MLKAVLLDIDGTLVDSNDQHARSWVDALAADGVHVGFEKVRSLIGMGGDKLLPLVSGIQEDSDRGKQIAERRAKIFRRNYLPQVKAFPQVRELLLALRARDLKLCVATSSDKALVDQLLQIAQVLDIIEKKASKDDAENSKPEPDILQAALKLAEVKPNEAIMIGDTPYDIEAAHRANVLCVAFRCGGWPDKGLAGALALYDDAADLLAQLATSPFSK